jgi:hypothetical protein
MNDAKLTRTRRLVALAVTVLGAPAFAQEPSSLYLRAIQPIADRTHPEVILSPEPPAGESQLHVGGTVRELDTQIVIEVPAPQHVIAGIHVAPTSAVLYLTTRTQPMNACAVIHADVINHPGSVLHDTLFTGTVTATLVPRPEGSLTTPIVIPLAPVPGAPPLAAGDTMGLQVRVQNMCGDGLRSVAVLFDSASQASRLVYPDDPASRPAFRDNCPLVVNPDQADSDADGMGDACDVCPIDDDPQQIDSDGDGVGNICDNCDDANADQLDSDDDGVGDVCQGVPPGPCPDGACGTTCAEGPAESLAALRCLIGQIRLRMAGAPATELAPGLYRRGAPLRLTLRRADRAARGAAVALRAGKPTRVGRNLRRVNRSLGRFSRRLVSAHGQGRVAEDLFIDVSDTASLAAETVASVRN